MKVEILRENGVRAFNYRDPNRSKHLKKGQLVQIKNLSYDLVSNNITHFYDYHGFVFELTQSEYKLL